MAASQQPPKDLNLNNLAVKDVLTVDKLTAANSTLGHSLINRATINTAVINDLIWVNEPGFYSVSESASLAAITGNYGPLTLFATYDEYNVVGSDISGEPGVDAAWTINTTGIYEFQFNAAAGMALASASTVTFRINGVAQSLAGSVATGATDALTITLVANATFSLAAGDTVDIAITQAGTVAYTARTMTIKRIV